MHPSIHTQLDSGSIPALELRGISYYRLGEFDTAQSHFREALKYDPEHKGCKDGHKLVKKMTKAKDKGDEAFQAKDYTEALRQYEIAVGTDPNIVVGGEVEVLKY